MNQERAGRFAAAWVEAWNRHDLERILAHYDEDVVMTSPFIAELTGDPTATIRGKATLRAYWHEALARFPDLRFELIGVYAGVEGLAIHYRSIRGLLACEVLTLNADGRISRAAAHYEVRADGPDASGPRVLGILETALTVADPPTSAGFYRRVFGLETLLESDRLVAMGVAGRDVLLLFREGSTSEPYVTPGGVIPPHAASGSSHLAFLVAAEDLPAWRTRLDSAGVPIESEVKWPAGPTSLYFRDPDDHLIELMTPGFWPFRSGRDSGEVEPSDGRLP